ncbi:MAG: hypothetical protein L3J41_01885 [Melioribacteraceae bacterium]|nr:hypothetical protein [Melioribacteraceae bacterium]
MIFRKNIVKRSITRKISNGIIGFFLSIFFIVAIFFGFSQTSTFRNMLKDEILELSKNSLNGELNIGKVEGTLITHLVLKDISFKKDADTILTAKKIEIALNPFYILVKRIKVTKFEIKDAQFNLLENEDETWNIGNIVKTDSSTILSETSATIVEEKTQKQFPFLFDISNFELSNITFLSKKFQYRGTNNSYDIMNYDDIHITNFNLSIDIVADINENDFQIDISSLSFLPNLNRFKLHNLSGEINVSENFAEVKNITLLTDSSMINFSAKLDSINLFNPLTLSNFKNYPIKLSLDALPFGASDLSSFIEPVDFMHGPISFNFDGEGKFGDFDFSALIEVDRTNINLTGNLTKLHTPEHLFVKAQFTNSQVDYSEVNSFLSGLELPKYPNLFVEDININYAGEPLKFNTSGSASVDSGELTFSAFMNLYPELIEYDYKIDAENVNLNSTLGIVSNLNAKGSLSGKGFDPEESNSNMDFIIKNSIVEGHNIDSVNVKLQTVDKMIDLIVFSKIDSMLSEVSGKLDLASTEKPIYNLRGKIGNLNIANLVEDTTLTSSLNFNFDVNGHSLDLDETEGEFILHFFDSQIGSNHFDSIHFDINLSKIDSTRLISFSSDILDFNITGDFAIAETFNLLSYQSKKIGYAISEKLEEMNPVEIDIDTTHILTELILEKDYLQNELYLDYDFNFKDFKLIAALLNRDKVEISGKGYGYVENDLDNFSISTTLDLDWLFLFKGKEVFYISGVESNIDIGVDNHKYSFDNIFGSLSFVSEEMVSDININNISSDLVFNQSKAFLNIEGNIDNDIDVGLEGFIEFKDSTESINISNLFFSYKDYLWKNSDSIIIKNTPSLFNISNFNLFNNNSSLTINGIISEKLNQDLQLEIKNANGAILANRLFGADIDETNSNINLTAKIKGTTEIPIYDLDFSIENLIINKNSLGSLYGEIKYEDFNLFTNIEFIDTLNNSGEKLLTLNGNIPINFSSANNESMSESNKTMDLELITNNFNIASFGDAIPTIKNPTGLINSDINITGKLSDMNYSGYLSLKNAKFTSALTNLDYAVSLNLLFENKKIRLGNTYIKNIEKTHFPGRMVLSGEILTDGLSLKSINIDMNGKIALLSPFSRETSPNFYGDLEIETENKWNYKYENEKSSISGNVVLGEVNLHYIPSTSSYSVTSSDFKYIFVNDSSKSELQKLKYEKLLSAISVKKGEENETTIPSNFDLDITIKAPDIAKLSVVLSKTLNQKLLADISGELRIRNINNQFTSLGQFDILPSSMFTFYKTFSAEGNIKFTDDIANPMINLTSTYIADYINPRNREAEPERTAVKIKINDSVNSLLENLASGKKPLDMKIYTGVQNIDYDIPNQQYNDRDAMYFILFGTFSTDSENANLAASAGMSVASSVVTTMLNAQLGDFVNNVNINTTGDQTRYNISGRVQKVRYTIGGTMQEISDWSQANAKLEYLFSPQFIIRAERKNPVISSSAENEKISEFGIMYRFSF